MALWTDSYYPFTIINKTTGAPIRIDVTKSARFFHGEIDGLADVTSDFHERGIDAICDFGAGKLRNALFLLQESFSICAVEHPLMFERPEGKEKLKAARRFKRFQLRTPAEFARSTDVFDALLLINVVNVVPEPKDRVAIVKACADRLKKGGLIVWMSQYGEPNYRRGATTRMRINDGYCYNLSHECQTFLKEFEIREIRELIPSSKYHELRQLNVRHHHAFVYERR
jgi:2-polyprenyl-3-methyl-5-hydroxy-6-metoxy-1,4-benzoquinol methylase